nr:WRKY transcription factor 5 [Crocus sativus]
MDELSRLAQIGFGFGPDLEADRLDPYVTIPSGFSPTALLDCPLGFPNPQEHPGFDGFDRHNQALFGMQIEFSNPVCFPKEDIITYTAELPIEISSNGTPHEAKCVPEQRNHPIGDTYEANGVSSQIQQLPVRDQVGRCPRTGTGKPSEDGYNWKKYGQKQVKGSEYPRSYYKCTHPSCLVKKKVERALDGQIREIIYSGSHNHSQPQATHQSAFGSSHAPNDMARDSAMGTRTEWVADHQEMTSSASGISDLDHVSTAKRKKPDLLTDDTKIDDDENGVTQRSMLHGDDGEFDETESKRRRIEYALTESSSISRAIREPRVIVQTVSEVDILEDGYRWRKYGQKVVKGNPNPR